MIYMKCRAQLGHLEAHGLLNKYLWMEKCHLKTTAAVVDPNAQGQRNATLPWFWSLDIQGDSVSSDWMNEFYRVHWLRTKALCDQWVEELLLVEHEIDWTLEFFLFKASMWLRRLMSTSGAILEGHKCYAIQQAHMYQELAKHAHTNFIKTNPTFWPIS
ncbi:hypothetical protein BDR06DRAFT_887551 [Suillus hirtellus]|nr:hypothetical protein BDR06DRAFT_887551 [Suillus hirtellus]